MIHRISDVEKIEYSDYEKWINRKNEHQKTLTITDSYNNVYIIELRSKYITNLIIIDTK